MRLLTIVHQEDSGPGVFLDVISGVDALSPEVWRPDQEPAPPAPPEAYDAILICGGAVNPPEEDRYPWLKTEKALLAGALDAATPMLGICLGAELIAEAAGTPTRLAPIPEIGWYEVKLTAAAAGDPLFGGLERSTFQALEWHSYEVPLPPGATALAIGEGCLQAYRLGDSAWGVQFHPEVTAADFQLWIDDIPNDSSWPLVGRDPDELLAETNAKLDDWHRFGRSLASRFLNYALDR